ncbi:hypothetical protein F5H01DRAFT_349997 [Linnemannia elongata]|nr:hypothetical protein F5H01DRAFT_349997 [Linnemannia elongata]
MFNIKRARPSSGSIITCILKRRILTRLPIHPSFPFWSLSAGTTSISSRPSPRRDSTTSSSSPAFRARPPRLALPPPLSLLTRMLCVTLWPLLKPPKRIGSLLNLRPNQPILGRTGNLDVGANLPPPNQQPSRTSLAVWHTARPISFEVICSSFRHPQA